MNLRKSIVSPAIAVTADLLIVFVVYALLRVEFLLENLSFFRESLADARWLRLLAAGSVFDTPGIFYTNAVWILLMLLPLHYKECRAYHRFCKWLFVGINAVGILASLADSVYFPFTMRRSTAEIFSEFTNENNLAEIVAIEALRHWYLTFLAALMIWGIWKLYFSPDIDIRRQSLCRYYILSTLALAAGALTTVSAIRGGLLNHWYNYLLALPATYIAWQMWRRGLHGRRQRSIFIAAALCALGLLITAPIGGLIHRDIRPISLSSAAAYTSRPVETALVLNTPFSIIRSFGKTVFTDPGYFSDKKEVDAIFSPIHSPADSVAPDAMKRRNVVVIIIESFGKDYIGGLNRDLAAKEGGFTSYTPFTDSLINHSAVWRHSFSNGRKSIDAMPSVLASIPMFIKPFVLTPKALNHIDGLPAHLRSMGYSSSFFHGARTGSMGFDAFAASVGFDRYFGREDFNKDSRFGGDDDFDGYWAIWDEPFLQYFALTLSEMPQPFMSAVFTASSHHPFRIPDAYRERFPEGEIPIQKCIRYTDNALRRFFETARRQPWFDNTIFVITADHSNESVHPEYKSAIGGFEIPIIFYDPAGDFPKGIREGSAQQIDIMPTILSWLGYPHPYIAFGKNLLDEEAGDWAVNYLNGTYQYVSEGHVLQFDGAGVSGLYSLDDPLMTDNRMAEPSLRPLRDRMTLRLKAIIQSYMDRMVSDSLSLRTSR